MTTLTAFNEADLSDKPFVLNLVVQKETAWSRRLKFYDAKTGLVIPLDGKTFLGEIRDPVGGTLVGSYVFAPNVTTDEVDVSLSVVTINALDPFKVYNHDWLYVESSIPVKVMTGTIQAEETYTVVP